MNDQAFISHIIEASEKISRYLDHISLEQFTTDEMRLDAVIREIEIIGEASSNLSEDFQQKHPDLPWQDMKSMRNKLAHEYFGVDEKIVWDTASVDVPKLVEKLRGYN